MKYRMSINSGGFNGYVVVQKRCLFIWKTVLEFSIYSYGVDAAFEEARKVLDEITKESE
jgi:hypothetical protein